MQERQPLCMQQHAVDAKHAERAVMAPVAMAAIANQVMRHVLQVPADLTETAGVRTRAQQRVKQQIEKYEETWFTGLLKTAGYRQNDWGFRCVSTPNTAQKRPKVAAKQPQQKDLDSLFEPEPYVAPKPKKRNVATFIMSSTDRYRLGLSFYSKTRRNYAWPGGNKQYNLSRSHTYELDCRPGEKICYGAWRDHQTYYWGVGRSGDEGCQSCCTTCGGTLQVTLSDAGPDSYGGSSSPSASINDVLDAVTGVLNGIQPHTYQQPTYTQPTYRRKNKNRPSDISGTR